MTLTDFIPPAGVLYRLAATDAAGVLDELAPVLARLGAMEPADVHAEIIEALQQFARQHAPR